MASRPNQSDSIPRDTAIKTAVAAAIASTLAVAPEAVWSTSTWCMVDRAFCKEECDDRYNENVGECSEIQSGSGANQCLTENANEKSACRTGCDDDYDACSSG